MCRKRRFCDLCVVCINHMSYITEKRTWQWKIMEKLHFLIGDIHLPSNAWFSSPSFVKRGGGRSVSQASGEQKKPPVLIPVVHEDTVDGKNPANQLRLVVYPLIYKVFYIQTVVRRISEPSTVCQVENCSALSDTECASEKSLCLKVKTGSLESSGLSKIPCPKNPNTSSRIEGSYLIPQEYRENPGVLGYIWILRGWFFLNLLGIMATRSEKYLGHWMSLEWSWTCFTPWNEQPKKPLKKWNAGLPLSFWGV